MERVILSAEGWFEFFRSDPVASLWHFLVRGHLSKVSYWFSDATGSEEPRVPVAAFLAAT